MIWPFSTINSLKKQWAGTLADLEQSVENFDTLYSNNRLQGELLDRTREELELERMRLVACGVAAMCNTPKSAAEQRVKKGSPYYCASVGDVHAAVDREMALREELEEANDRAFRATEAHVGTMGKFQDALDHMTSMMKGEGDLVGALKFLNQHRSTKHCIKCGSEMIPLHGEDKKLCSNGACGHEIDWKLEEGQQYQYKRNVEPFVEDRSASSLPPATNQQRL